MERACVTCGSVKPTDQFPIRINGRNGLKSPCSACKKREYRATYRSTHPEWRDIKNLSRRQHDAGVRASPEHKAAVQQRATERAAARAATSLPPEDARRLRNERMRAYWHAVTKFLPSQCYRTNPKLAARVTLRRNVQCGKVVKPGACTECGRSDLRIEGHHTDYTKPLDVVWLCSSCHGLRHRID